MTAPARPVPPESPARHGLLFVLGVVIAPLVVFGLIVPVTVVFAIGPLFCRPPSAEQLDRQRAFVLSHLPEARDVLTGHSDCDDNGRGYVEFTTELAPDRALARFLTDPACSAATSPLEDEVSATCLSDGLEVFLTLEAADGEETFGRLDMPSP